MTSRYQPTDTFNTGTITAGSSAVFNRTIPVDVCDLMKIKVVPSGSSVGWKMEIFKKATCLAADRVFATKSNVLGNFYAPTDRSGNEVLEGFVVPYEDLDAAKQIHIKITNQDAVSRNYDVSLVTQTINSYFVGSVGMQLLVSSISDTPRAGVTNSYASLILQYQGTLDNTLRLESYGSGNPQFVGRHAIGTYAAPTAVQVSNRLVSLCGVGYGATGYSSTPRGIVAVRAAENWTDTAQGTYISFSTTAIGDTVPTTFWTIGTVNTGVLRPNMDNTSAIGDSTHRPSVVYSMKFISSDTVMVTVANNLTGFSGSYTATLDNAPVAGDPSKWVTIDDGGVTRVIPTWNL